MAGTGAIVDRSGTERLVAFTDAVVAIAITLLVLPLVDEFASAPRPSGQAVLAHALAAHSGQLFAFVLSFALIARLWWWHHGTFRHIQTVTIPLMIIDLAWLFTIVALPLPTVIVAAWDSSDLAFATYAGDLVLSAVALTVIGLMEYRRTRADDAARGRLRRGLIASWTTVTVFVAALAVGLAATPGWGYACYWLLALTGVVVRVVDRPLAARESVSAAPE